MDTQIKMYLVTIWVMAWRYFISKLTEEARQYKKKAISADLVWTEAETL